jgi:hypothetical protein
MWRCVHQPLHSRVCMTHAPESVVCSALVHRSLMPSRGQQLGRATLRCWARWTGCACRQLLPVEDSQSHCCSSTPHRLVTPTPGSPLLIRILRALQPTQLALAQQNHFSVSGLTGAAPPKPGGPKRPAALQRWLELCCCCMAVSGCSYAATCAKATAEACLAVWLPSACRQQHPEVHASFAAA